MIRPQLFTNHKISKGVTPVRRTGNFLKLASVAAIGALSFGVAPYAASQETEAVVNPAVEATSELDLSEDSAELETAPLEDSQPATTTAAASTTAAAPTTVASSAAPLPVVHPQLVDSPVQEESLDVESLEGGMFKVTLTTNERTAGDTSTDSVVTLKYANTERTKVTVYPARVDGTKIATAVARAESMNKDFDLVSFDVDEVSTAANGEVSFIYEPDTDSVNASDELKAWKIADEDQKSAFELGETLGAKPRTFAAYGVSPTTSGSNSDPYWTSNTNGEDGKVVDKALKYDFGELGMVGQSYHGALVDPDFGGEHEQNPKNYYYGDQSFTYPIRHRNWSAREYYVKKTDGDDNRWYRGPEVIGGGSGGANDTVTYNEQEQGYFFSRDHVQHAWSEGNRVYRGDEFLIGGGDPDAVWFGGSYGNPHSVRVDLSGDFKRSGEPGFKIYIENQLNTDDPGWIKIKDTISTGFNVSRDSYSYISPEQDLLIRIGRRDNYGTIDYQFYDLEAMKQDGLLKADLRFNTDKVLGQIFGELGTSLLNYRIGIKTPNWSRVFLAIGTTETPTGIQSVNTANGYLYSKFMPEFEMQRPTVNREKPVPSITKTVKHSNSEPAWKENEETGKKYIDYTIDVKAPKEKGEYFYKVEDTPDFGPGLKVRELKIQGVTGKSKSEFAVKKSTTSDGDATFTIGQKVARNDEHSDYLEIWENQTHSIEVRAYFDAPKDKAIKDQQCSAGHGLYNEAALNVYGSDEKPSDDACATYNQKGEDPKPDENVTITKKVDPASDTQAWSTDSDGKYYIDYTLKVETAERAKSLYKIRETPDFGKNIKVTDLKIQNVEGKNKDEFKVTPSESTGGVSSFIISQKESREVSAFPQLGKNDFLEIWGAPNPAHEITLRAYFDPNDNNIASTAGECKPGDSLYNKATITLPGDQDGASAEDCADFEEEKFFGTPTVKKTVVPVSDEQAWGETPRNGKMTKYIDYTIEVTAPAKETNYKYWYTVTDTPSFGNNLKVTDVELSKVEGTSREDIKTVVSTGTDGVKSVLFKSATMRQKSYGPQHQHEYLEIAAAKTHTLHIRAFFDKVNKNSSVSTGEQCQAGDGLYNMATLGLPNETEGPSDDACAPFVDDEPEEEPGVTVGVAKMNEKNEYLPIGTEYSFSIYDKDGTEVKLDHVEEHGDSSTTFEIKKSKEQALKVGERYTLVETKAPAGFELLAEAVAFTVQRAEDGELGLEIEDAHRHPQVQVLTLGDKQDENSVYFAVADMRQGDLPASGDRGVFWTLGLGIAALIAAAGATLRRRA